MPRPFVSILCTLGLLASLPASSFAQAGPSAPGASGASSMQVLVTCLADKTTGRDSKDLAKWVFLSMAAHPDIKGFLAPGLGAATTEVNKTAANLFVRLLTESCPAEVRAATRDGGSAALTAAFGTFGQIAMQEIMTNDDVKAALSGIDPFVDQQRILQALQPTASGAAPAAPATPATPKP